MEIERKYLICKDKLPVNYSEYPCLIIEQAYLCREPVVRVRKQNNEYYLTYKSKGLMEREEYNLPLTEESYNHLLKKADGAIIKKKRYLIPLKPYTIELDVFQGKHEGLILAEVEFRSREEAEEFNPPVWFGEDVTFSSKYHNSTLSQ
ncbi:MAG: CYTH domain-containing protein [Lachnospiraceae bacterium]